MTLEKPRENFTAKNGSDELCNRYGGKPHSSMLSRLGTKTKTHVKKLDTLQTGAAWDPAYVM